MMNIPCSPSTEPPALAALRDHPLLLNTVASSITQQANQVISHATRFIGRETALAELHALLLTLDRGLIALEGDTGSGVTTLLAYLAATQPFAFWFSNDDDRQGAAALAAQLIALHRLSVPLIPPAIQRDPSVMEQFLTAIAAHTTADRPIVILADPPGSLLQPAVPFPINLPGTLPPGVVVIYGNTPGRPPPIPPAARILLPQAGDEVLQDQTRVLQQINCPAEWIGPIIAMAQGNMLYLSLAYRFLHAGLLTLQDLAPGLNALYNTWWQSLDLQAQRLALLLATASEPLPIELCVTLLEADPQPLLATWDTTGLIKLGLDTTAFVHWSTREYIAHSQRIALAEMHTQVAKLASSVLELKGHAPDSPAPPRSGSVSQEVLTYLARQLSRHAALGTPKTREETLPLVTHRSWVLMQERRDDTFMDAAHDLAWELRHVATAGPALRLALSAALAGTLASKARTLSPDAAVAALIIAVEQLGREVGLKQVRSLVDQLPDAHEKSLILRQLGEACYGLQMRTSAMRLLSQALDIEEHKRPLLWREQREQLFAALAGHALTLGSTEVALEIGARIGHLERRGMVETQVMRWLLEQADLARAQAIARQIEHENLGAWAQAEVAIHLARAGDLAAAEHLLTQVQTETARAWAHIKLACDMCVQDEQAARQRIDLLDNPHQHDRGLAELARALAQASKDGDALDAAAQISDVATQVSALLDLRLMLEGLVAMLALEQATAVVGRVPGDARVPLTAMLAASYAALGKHTEALRVADQLTEGEERDRALSRVSVALARRGDYGEALSLARALTDEDERDWTLDELAHILADAGLWQTSQELCAEISGEEQRSQTMADLVITRARAGEALIALHQADSIPFVTEYARAINMIAPLLVSQGHAATALSLVVSSGNFTEESTHTAEDEVAPVLPDDSPSNTTAQVNQHTLSAIQVSRYLASVVTALAEQGHLLLARQTAHTVQQPLDRGRAYLAIALAVAKNDPEQACVDLGKALLPALIGRNEAFRLLEQSVPVFAALDGASLLQNIAAAIDEVDTW